MENNRILVVEDEHIVALDIKMHLENYGYSVPAIYATGEEVLVNFELIDPLLVIMDIKLQGRLDGLETAREIKRRYRVPVVLLTAHADEATVERAKESQPFGYIIKPFEERELRTAIVVALSRHEMEQEIRRREQLFSTTLNSIGDGVVVTDTGNTVQFMNPVAARMVEMKPEDCVGCAMDEILSLECDDDQADDDGGVAYLVSGSGTRTAVDANSSPLHDETNRIRGTVWVYRDISERLASQQALRESQEQLRHAQKMEAVGRLSGGIAHDFNNLLTVILGYTRILSEELQTEKVPDPDTLINDVEGIQKAARRSVSLTRQLLAFSRRQVLKPTRVNLNDAVRDLEKMLRRLITEQVRLHLNLKAEPSDVYVDPGQMEQVLMNLVVNARDAMNGGGRIHIRTYNVELGEPATTVAGRAEAGHWICLEVEDSGCGMDQDTREKIFDPFFTTKEAGVGTGLGLSTVYGIVRQTNGHIDLDSTPGHGTTFRIMLPPYDGAAEVKHAETEAVEDHSGSERVLLVEDDDAIRSMLARILREHGYTVMETQSGGEALLIAEDENTRFDLLVTDQVMPHITGLRLSERIRGFRPEVGVLLLSGYPEEFPERNKLPEGAVFLPKPFEPEDLLRSVRQVLES
ncbi:MAG: response regulator [Spirochaetes bacterium]|jgi:PAS domain S-box-containing protein|nr:response regulator [Spirochaetota bacterium]